MCEERWHDQRAVRLVFVQHSGGSMRAETLLKGIEGKRLTYRRPN